MADILIEDKVGLQHPVETLDVSPLATDSDWSVINTTLPTGSSQMITAVDGDYIYVIGGSGSSDPAARMTRRFDTVSGTWTTLAQTPAGVLSTHRGLVFNGCIYIVGYNTDAYKYDIRNNTWSSISKPPYDMSWAGTLPYNNKLYVFGGHSGKSSVYSYDPTTNRWTSHKSLPYSFNYGDVGMIGNELYLIGGEDSLKAIYKYNLSTGDTTKLSVQLPLNCRHHSCISTEEGIYIIGSLMKGENQPVLRQVLLFDGNEVVKLDDLPIAMFAPGVEYINNTIYLFHSSNVLVNTIGQSVSETRYFIYEIDNELYTEIDGQLSKLNGMTLTEETILEYGVKTYNKDLLTTVPSIKLHIYEQNPAVVGFNFTYSTVYKGQTFIQDYDFEPTVPVKKLTLTATVNANDVLNVLLSNDSGKTWYTLSNSEWIETSIDNIATDGLSHIQTNILTASELNALIGDTNKLRLALYLKQAKSNVALKLDHIRLEYSNNN